MIFVRSGAKAGTAKNTGRVQRSALATTNSEGGIVIGVRSCNEANESLQDLTPKPSKARRAHSAVESAINGLEVHGLDVCRDHGIKGFKRYVALAVVARNIHRIGAIVWQQEVEREQRESKYADRDTTYKLAA